MTIKAVATAVYRRVFFPAVRPAGRVVPLLRGQREQTPAFVDRPPYDGKVFFGGKLHPGIRRVQLLRREQAACDRADLPADALLYRPQPGAAHSGADGKATADSRQGG